MAYQFICKASIIYSNDFTIIHPKYIGVRHIFITIASSSIAEAIEKSCIHIFNETDIDIRNTIHHMSLVDIFPYLTWACAAGSLLKLKSNNGFYETSLSDTEIVDMLRKRIDTMVII